MWGRNRNRKNILKAERATKVSLTLHLNLAAGCRAQSVGQLKNSFVELPELLLTVLPDAFLCHSVRTFSLLFFTSQHRCSVL